MRIRVYYRYFWPDTPPYAVMLRDITGWLAGAGHDVFMGTAQPAYKPEAAIARQPVRQSEGGVDIRRFALLPESSRGAVRIVNSLWFVLRATMDVLFSRRADVVWTATMPPVLQAFALMLAAKVRRAKFLYHMQDIYPEIAEAASGRGGLLFNLLRAIDNITLRRADAIVVLSDDMRNTIRDRIGEVGHVHVINNYALETAGDAEPTKDRRDGKVRFIFAGNIGRHQNLEKLLEAFAAMNDDGAELLFVGEGAAKRALQERAAQLARGNVRFEPHMPVAEAFKRMRAADVGVVSLNPGLFRLAFPSKLLTYFAAGLPVMAFVESESVLSRLLKNEKLGQSCAPDASVMEVASALSQMTERLRTGQGFSPVPGALYQPDARKADWLALLSSLENGAQSAV